LKSTPNEVISQITQVQCRNWTMS